MKEQTQLRMGQFFQFFTCATCIPVRPIRPAAPPLPLLAAAGSALLAALPGRPATSCRSRYAPKSPAQLICRAYGMQPHAAVRSKGGTHSSSASHRRLQLLLRGLGHEQHPTTAVER
eukprot:COSAG01_NODE_17929_length_1113_cov_2.306706_1_plen_116_part_01